MSQPTTHLYRSILRELRLASRKSRITRNPTVHTHIREVVAAGPTDLNKTLLEIRDFLKSTRIHAELLKRYNPIADMTEEERIHATARRVGLDTPQEYKKD
ncbi:hypothetical protein DB88DRAFT_511387 [Papiliotrema laurentii]|uniref:Complex 1 LYR protein n=1 Tax=Papiliotrema laurentii TaxID=5418 RepID=A0AAD9CXF2_PAPLA|nr:hypothetical protein DB88DRAFT_511387 [Papiliotrema laurentii]